MVRNLLLLSILFIFSKGLHCQVKVGVLIKGNSTYIEKYQKDFENIGYQFVNSYRLGLNSSTQLKTLVKKAIEWAELNKTHKKSFEKSMGRIKVMSADEYKLHGYTDQLAQDLELIFYGYENGMFKLKICNAPCMDIIYFLEFESIEELESFYNMLLGKTISKEIDDIFK
jgi:hypothetical protein